MELARRLQNLDGGIFNELATLKQEAEKQGVYVINLSVGSPDLPPAPHIRQALSQGALQPDTYGYTLSEGIPEFKEAVAHWYHKEHGIELDAKEEILPLIGSQDGLAHIYLSYVNPGDIALIPDPGYPIYSQGLAIAEGIKYPLVLKAENDFLPLLQEIPEEIASKAKLMVLNYPSNPLAATATLDFFQEVVEFAKKYEIIVCHDFAYSQLAFDNYRPISFLQAKGAKEVGVEFHSLSKTYNMAGCRLGFLVGNKNVIDGLRKIKSMIDYGNFKAIQLAGIAALKGSQDYVKETALSYERRRDILIEGLAKCDWTITKPKASMFLWAPLPWGYTSSWQFTKDLLNNCGVLVVPGTAFGTAGEGYVRIGLVQKEELLHEVVARIEEYWSSLR